MNFTLALFIGISQIQRPINRAASQGILEGKCCQVSEIKIYEKIINRKGTTKNAKLNT